MVERTHFTWSVEGPDSTCPHCHGKTVLVCAGVWEADEEACNKALGLGAYREHFADGVDIAEEITGHYCNDCGKLVSLSFNA